MKKINTLSLLCLCSVAALAVGCTKADKQIPMPINANIQSTEAVLIDNEDVSVDFAITLTQKLNQDITVRVVPKGDVEAVNLPVSDFLFQTTGEDADGNITSPEIKKEGRVVFKSSAFPDLNSTATVELVLESDEISLSQDSKVTIVASRKQPTPPAPITAAISVTKSEITVGDTDKEVEFTITLSEALTNDAAFTLTATSESGVPDSYELNDETITIAAGQTTGTGNITFKTAAFTCEHIVVEVTVTASTESEVIMSEASVTIKATKEPEPEPVV